MQQGDLVIGIDVGTTSVKGAVYTLQGTMLFSKTVTYGTSYPRSGWVEQQPRDWMDAIAKVMQGAVGEMDLSRVKAVGICSQVNTHVFVDEKLNVLIPAIIWQDQRCAKVADELEALVQKNSLAIAVDSSALVSRAQWVRQHRPEVWELTRFILSPKDYCIAVLTGEVATDALSSIGLVTAAGTYDEDLDSLVPDLSARLPPVRSMTQRIGEISHDHVPSHCPIVVGTMDAWASVFGSGTVDVESGVEISGTSEIIGALSREALPATGIITFPPLDGAYLHAGPTQCGGDALAWFARSIGKSIGDTLALANSVSADREPLLFLPHLMGERAPLWDPTARGAFIGLTKTHSAADMAHAVLEGVGFSARQLLSSVEEAAGFRLDSLRLSGGGARSDLWCQIKADIHGRTLERVRNIDTGTFGAGLLAAVGVGEFPNINAAAKSAVSIDREFVPDPAVTQRYSDLYGLYRNAYAGLKDVFGGLVSLHSR